MEHRIHIFGASGSGTTALGVELARHLECPQYDVDDYFWIQSEIPYTEIRPVDERIPMLRADIESADCWILTGSLCGWGDFAIPLFTCAVFLWIPGEIRLKRLRARETSRFGREALSPGGWFHEEHSRFMDWASRYDTGGLDIRSRALHEAWMNGLSCTVIRVEEALPADALAAMVMREIGAGEAP